VNIRTLYATIYAKRFIGTEEIAESFFSILEKYGFLPDKVDLYEPMKKAYSLDEAVNMWTFSEGESTLSGSILGKKLKPKFVFMASWSIGKNARPNYIFLDIHPSTFKKNREVIDHIFHEIFILVDGLFGYISYDKAESRQRIPGGLNRMLPGVFWCNYFSPLYVDFFGEDKLLAGPWIKTERLENGTVVTFLAEEPEDLLESVEREQRAKEYLGTDCFGDRELYLRDKLKDQYRRVPDIQFNQ
jgi:hypothetical protein